MNVEVIKANYLNTRHEKEIQFLLNVYASDPMGGGKPLDNKIKETIVKELSKLPYAFSLITYVEREPAGLANCFESFSTFACRPLINIHDFVVLEKYRGNGISQKMLKKVEEIALSKGCCKITLEILSNNEAAKASYKKFGFTSYELDPKEGVALFWQKNIMEDKIF
ncbi:MAG: GNAT family N-acetyltransferase [Desulfobacula sp.]|uniref:GNAT family N-acetyltransferase n=1 Tax=Desulfobacula sp. TaxID=2593537 RepID=UPI0025C2849B|nr:GNAT family N-acetyltransferase [Desulfobacula sp.]MCD4718847.1 GNAT family N-acetyltransferase [Desulfobacula sp.]